MKKILLGVSILGTLLFALLVIISFDSCYASAYCRSIRELDYLSNDNLLVVYIFPVTLFLSLITLKMREEAFRAWWNFARWIVPVIIIATIWVNSQQTGRGFFNLDALGYPLILGPLYLALIIVSLWKIMRVYRTPVVMKEK
jgi:hypothetical protein